MDGDLPSTASALHCLFRKVLYEKCILLLIEGLLFLRWLYDTFLQSFLISHIVQNLILKHYIKCKITLILYKLRRYFIRRMTAGARKTGDIAFHTAYATFCSRDSIISNFTSMNSFSASRYQMIFHPSDTTQPDLVHSIKYSKFSDE